MLKFTIQLFYYGEYIHNARHFIYEANIYNKENKDNSLVNDTYKDKL